MPGSRLSIVVVLSACGRIAFEPPLLSGDARSDTTACATVGHDEDADGIDDACDLCPQVVDDGADADGDGVGDACDPAPTQQQRTFFDPFTSARSEWLFDMRSMLLDDSVTLPGTMGAIGLVMLGAPGRAVFEAGGRTMTGSGNRQLAIHLSDATSAADYYCEFYGPPGAVNFNITHTLDGVNFSTLGNAPVAGSLEDATFRMAFEHTPPALKCVGWLNGVRYEAAGTDLGGVTPSKMAVSAFNVDAEVEYFVRLATP